MHRGEPERARPIRNTSLAVRSSGQGRGDFARGVVERGVENAYRVYEEYMRRGREAADGMSRLTTGRRAPRFDGDMRDIAEGAGHYFTDMMEMWLSLLSPAGFGRRPQRGERRRARHASDPLDLVLSLRSTRPVEVTLDLHEEDLDGPVHVNPLHPVGEHAHGHGRHRHDRDHAHDHDHGRDRDRDHGHDHDHRHGPDHLRGARLDHEGGRLRLRLTVPDELPAGAYFGVVIDRESGEAAGTLRVVVRAA
ncbi:MAG: hypothetical protein U0359_09900 [Byssovorax sp.]